MPRLDGDEPLNRDLRAIGKHDVSDFGIHVYTIDSLPDQRLLKKAHRLLIDSVRKTNRDLSRPLQQQILR
jgi:hypothetical protein